MDLQRCGRSVGYLLVGLISLFFSGAGSLIAQSAIQRYVAVRSGGADAFISSAISFAFIAGIAGGAVLSGILASRQRYSLFIWVAAELVCAAALPLLIPVYRNVLDIIIQHWSFGLDNIAIYYFGLFVSITVICGAVAGLMGANYPAAYAVISSGSRTSNRTAILILASNTFGAAAGCCASVYLLPNLTLPTMLACASGLYLVAGLLPLAFKFRAPTSEPMTASAKIDPKTDISRGSKLLFISGLIGFSYQVLLFRHFSLLEHSAYWIFSVVLGILLVFWATGTLASMIVRVLSVWVLIGLALSQACAAALLLYPVGPDLLRLHFDMTVADAITVLLLFLPVAFSGWYFGVVHNELTQLNARGIGLIYGFNLAGTFVGGIAATYLLPEAMRTSFIFIPVLGALGTLVAVPGFYGRNLRPGTRYAVMLLCLLALVGILVLPTKTLSDRYYRSTTRLDPKIRIEVEEDWGVAAWLAGDDFLVGGRGQSPVASNPCGGYRSQQMLVPALLKKNARIFYVGVGAGISNGGLGRLLPDSTIESMDYSRAVGRFWVAHPELNFDLLHQANNHVRVMDGRLALSLDSGKYDIIQEYGEAEGIRGISTIKSIEFVRMVKAHLQASGVFVAVGFSSAYAATLQKVFSKVWMFDEIPIFMATDGDLTTMFDPAGSTKIGGKISCIDTILNTKGVRQRLSLLPPIQETIVSDAYPVADYASRLQAVDPRLLETTQKLELPFPSAKLIDAINQRYHKP